MLDEFEELRELVEPVKEYIAKKHNPHTAVIITDSYVKVTLDVMGMPINKTNHNILKKGEFKRCQNQMKQNNR